MFKIVIFILLIGEIAATPFTLPRPRLQPGRIVGGEAVDIKEVPYVVSYRLFGQHVCGANIISNYYCLTAAHCTDRQQVANIDIRAGSVLRNSGGIVIAVAAFFQHPDYNSATIDFDYSILGLQKPLEYSSSIQPIALPDDNNILDGAYCRVSGWGNTQNANESPLSLRAVNVPIVNQTDCHEAYARFGGVTERMICAGYPGGMKDACQGDSGGPLTTIRTTFDDKPKLVGVVSWDYGCAREGYPGVYSRVAVVREWIRSITSV